MVNMSNKEIDQIFGSIKKALNPELDIPVDEKDNPVNYRIVRLRSLVEDLRDKQKQQMLELEKIETNLTALLEEINKSGDKG